MIRGIKSNQGLFFWLAAGLLLLNLADSSLTLLGVSTGFVTEANPLLAGLVDAPLAFALVKFALVSAGVAVLWHYRARRLSLVGLATTFAVYAWVVFFAHTAVLPGILARLT